MLSACRTTTFWAIPGLNQTFKVVETVFSSEMVWKVVAAANMNDFLPYLVVLTWGTSNMFEYLKAYLELFTLTKSWRHTGANLLTIVYVSKA